MFTQSHSNGKPLNRPYFLNSPPLSSLRSRLQGPLLGRLPTKTSSHISGFPKDCRCGPGQCKYPKTISKETRPLRSQHTTHNNVIQSRRKGFITRKGVETQPPQRTKLRVWLSPKDYVGRVSVGFMIILYTEGIPTMHCDKKVDGIQVLVI